MNNLVNDESVKLITKKLEEIENGIDGHLTKNNSLKESNGAFFAPNFEGLLYNIKHKCRSLRKEFDSNTLFIVCFGALKSGKSTLINALAKKYVSPTGYGAETTLRCSIIMKANNEHPEGITLYGLNSDARSNGIELDENNIIKILDYLKGTVDWSEISNVIEKSKIFPIDGKELSDEGNLSYILTNDKLDKLQGGASYFNIAEIRVNSDNLNDSNILFHDAALIDLPGLDGAKTNIEKDAMLKYLPKHSHYFLFMQSSVAALNKATKEALELWSDNKNVKAALVFNKMQSKHWIQEKYIDNEISSQQDKAQAQILKIFKDPDKFTLNAAMAWDSCKESEMSDKLLNDNSEYKAELEKKSNIQPLRNDILKNVKENRDNIIKNTVMGKVKEFSKAILSDSPDQDNNLSTFNIKQNEENNSTRINKEQEQWVKLRNYLDDNKNEYTKNVERKIDDICKEFLKGKNDEFGGNETNGIIQTVFVRLSQKANNRYLTTDEGRKYKKEEQRQHIDNFITNDIKDETKKFLTTELKDKLHKSLLSAIITEEEQLVLKIKDKLNKNFNLIEDIGNLFKDWDDNTNKQILEDKLKKNIDSIIFTTWNIDIKANYNVSDENMRNGNMVTNAFNWIKTNTPIIGSKGRDKKSMKMHLESLAEKVRDNIEAQSEPFINHYKDFCCKNEDSVSKKIIAELSKHIEEKESDWNEKNHREKERIDNTIKTIDFIENEVTILQNLLPNLR